MVHSMVRRSTCIDNVRVGSYVKRKNFSGDVYWMLITELDGYFFRAIMSKVDYIAGKNSKLKVNERFSGDLRTRLILDIYNDMIDD